MATYSKVRAWQIGNHARVAGSSKTGVIDDVAIIDGTVKYHVVSDTSEVWDEWFDGWAIEHA